MDKTVFFVASVRSPNAIATSTNIMTSLLLQGLSDNNCKTVFFAICEYESEKEEIIKYYSKFVKKIVIIPCKTKHQRNKYKHLINLILNSKSRFYEHQIRGVLSEIHVKPSLIISHSPGFDAAYYAIELKKIFKTTLLYQYWSDPVALAGILPEQVSASRRIHKYLEKSVLKPADKVIYGTQTLLYFQKILYRKYASKMSYIDVPCKQSASSTKKFDDHYVLYAGNYYSKTRNILPLTFVISKNPSFSLDIYGDGDIELPKSNNIICHDRVSPSELELIEKQYSVKVCVLNHSCIQIPGKLFYDMADKSRIIVILDGKYKNVIMNYLAKFNRFVFCDNNIKSIATTLQCYWNSEIKTNNILSKYSPKSVTADLLDGGKLN